MSLHRLFKGVVAAKARRDALSPECPCPRTDPSAHAADILEAAMRDIDADKGDVSAEAWGSLLAVLGILRGQHGLFDPAGAQPSTVPDHLPDNDESRGHGSVR